MEVGPPVLVTPRAAKSTLLRAVVEGAWTGAVAGLLLLYGVAAGFLIPPYPDPGMAAITAALGTPLAAFVGAVGGVAVASAPVALFLALPASIQGLLLSSRRSTAVTLFMALMSAVVVGVVTTGLGILLFTTEPLDSDRIRFLALVGWPVVAALWRAPVVWRRLSSPTTRHPVVRQ